MEGLKYLELLIVIWGNQCQISFNWKRKSSPAVPPNPNPNHFDTHMLKKLKARARVKVLEQVEFSYIYIYIAPLKKLVAVIQI